MPFATNISLAEARKGFYPHWAVDYPTVLIQIQSPDFSPMASFIEVPMKGKFKSVHQFRFADVEECEVGSLSDSQAKEIASIVKKAYTDGDNLLVHCHQGFCRSGAVVQVALEAGFMDIDRRERKPNPFVLQLVKGCLFGGKKPSLKLA